MLLFAEINFLQPATNGMSAMHGRKQAIWQGVSVIG
jgi:hypothetical protein